MAKVAAKKMGKQKLSKSQLKAKAKIQQSKLKFGGAQKGADIKKLAGTENLIQVNIFDETRKEIHDRLAKTKESKKSAVARFMAKLSKKEVGEEAALYGELVGNNTPLGKSRVVALKKNPLNIDARLDLIEDYVKQESKVTLEVLKEVYINALFVVSLDTLSARAVNYAIMAQKNYFVKVKSILTDDAKRLMTRLQDERAARVPNEAVEKQITKLYNNRVGLVNFLNVVLRVLPPRKISNQDLKVSILEMAMGPGGDEAPAQRMSRAERIAAQKGAKQKVDPAKDINDLMRGAIYLPPVRDRVVEIGDLLRKKFPHRPIGFLYQAKLHKINAIITDAAIIKEKVAATPGLNIQEMGKTRKMQIEKAIVSIRNAVNILPDVPTEAIEKACIEEYGLLLLEIHRMAPNYNIREHCNNCIGLLGKLVDSGNREQIMELQNRLHLLNEKMSPS